MSHWMEEVSLSLSEHGLLIIILFHVQNYCYKIDSYLPSLVILEVSVVAGSVVEHARKSWKVCTVYTWI